MGIRKISRSWRGAMVLMTGISGVTMVTCYGMACSENSVVVLAAGAVAAIVALAAGYCGFSIGKPR
jgi:hypothetical protein